MLIEMHVSMFVDGKLCNYRNDKRTITKGGSFKDRGNFVLSGFLMRIHVKSPGLEQLKKDLSRY